MTDEVAAVQGESVEEEDEQFGKYTCLLLILYVWEKDSVSTWLLRSEIDNLSCFTNKRYLVASSSTYFTASNAMLRDDRFHSYKTILFSLTTTNISLMR